MDPAPSTEPARARLGVPVLIEAGTWQLATSMHVRTEPVNAWLLTARDGSVTIFDTGVGVAAEERWAEAIASIDRRPADVAAIIVSHHHPDHIGGAGALHRLTGAQLFASRSTIEQAPDVWGDGGRLEAYVEAMQVHMIEHGFPRAKREGFAHEAGLVRLEVELPPDDAWRPLDPGDEFELGGRTWCVQLTPGHADGHLALHDEDSGRYLAGDHLLERISPAVGRFPRHAPDPLGDYLASLAATAQLDITLVLPGHGAPFTCASARAHELMRHHEMRMGRCITAVLDQSGTGEPTTYDVAHMVFAKVFASEPSDPANEQFATTETLAHLERAQR